MGCAWQYMVCHFLQRWFSEKRAILSMVTSFGDVMLLRSGGGLDLSQHYAIFDHDAIAAIFSQPIPKTVIFSLKKSLSRDGQIDRIYKPFLN